MLCLPIKKVNHIVLVANHTSDTCMSGLCIPGYTSWTSVIVVYEIYVHKETPRCILK